MKIEPCPWNRGVAERLGRAVPGPSIVSRIAEQGEDAPVMYAVRCEACGATGPSKPTMKEAVEAWNQTVREIEEVHGESA